MNLTIDIGNTRAKAATFEGDMLVDFITTDHQLTGLEAWVRRQGCQHGIISTTATLSPNTEKIIDALPFDVLRMAWDTPTPVRNLYRTPQTLGPDRLAAIVGAWTKSPGSNILVIDCGTCVTYDFVDEGGIYRGGNISPGLEMRLEAMHQLTARLPRVHAEGDIPKMGYDTETALRSGAIIGLRNEIEGYICRFQQEFGSVLFFLTGGDAKKLGISKEFTIFADDFLVLRGLNCILEYNK